MNFGRPPVPPLPPGVPRYPNNGEGRGVGGGGGGHFQPKVGGISGVMYAAVVLMNMVNIACMGYSFSFHKGTWRNNLFHSELAFLVVFCACFIGTVVNIIGSVIAPQPFATNTVQEEVSAAVNGILAALASTVLLIQLSVYGEYFVNDFGLKVFAGILGLTAALVYLALAFVLHRSAQALM